MKIYCGNRSTAMVGETVTNMDDIEYMVFPRFPGYAGK
jgi:hypothetical protein